MTALHSMLAVRFAVVALCAFIPHVIAQVDYEDVPNVFSQDALDDIRSECKTVDDDLFIGSNWTGDANLDGIEVITGSLKLFACSAFVASLNPGPCEDASDSSFTVSSSTLKEVGEFIEKSPGALVKSMKFPKLESVGGRVDILDNGHLEELDLTDLSKVDHLLINGTAKLKNVKANGIHNVTCKGRDCGIQLWNCNGLESIGNLATGNTTSQNNKNPELRLGSNDDNVGNGLANTEIVFGWTNTSLLHVEGPGMTLRLGGSEIEEMYVENGYFRLDTQFKRSDDLRNLTIGTALYSSKGMRGGTTEELELEKIDFPFDHVFDLQVTTAVSLNDSVERISLPERASRWDGVNLKMEMARTKFEAESDNGTTMWHWPQYMGDVELVGQIDMDLFELFREQVTRVYGNFQVSSTSDGLECKELKDRIQGKINGIFSCFSYESESGGSMDVVRWLFVAGLATFSGLFLAL